MCKSLSEHYSSGRDVNVNLVVKTQNTLNVQDASNEPVDTPDMAEKQGHDGISYEQIEADPTLDEHAISRPAFNAGERHGLQF